MAKSLQILTHTQTGTGMTAVHSWTVKMGNLDGTDRVLTLNAAKLHPEIAADIIDERLIAKCGDAAAKPRDPKTGLSESPVTKSESILAVITRLESGARDAWNAKRAAQVAEYDIGPWMCQALVALGDTVPAVMGDPVKAQALVVRLTPAQKKAVSLRPDVAAKITELQRAATADIDTDALLAGLI